MSWIVLIKGAMVPLAILAVVPLLVWVERRGSAFIQDRRGPNRARIANIHMAGIPHTLADGIKFVTKESFIPKNAYKPLYFIAPFFAVAPIMTTVGVVPIAEAIEISGETIYLQGIPQLDTGAIFFFALASLSVYAIILGGWSSNNRYSLLGGLRSSAQMISYEISLGLTLMVMLMIYNTAELNEIVRYQGRHLWGIVYQPHGFLLFLIVGVAETERIPFDMPEAESEVVAGFHTEYSGLKFSMYMLGQYVSTIAISAIVVTVFLGGWQVPFLSTDLLRQTIGMGPTAILQVGSFLFKMALIFWAFVWLRWTLPRFRYDQLMDLGWKQILPIAIVNIFLTGAVILLVSG